MSQPDEKNGSAMAELLDPDVLFPACRQGRHNECIGYEPPSNLSWMEGADACDCACHDSDNSEVLDA